MQSKSIIWLRRDLRLDDHFVLNCAQKLKSKSLPIFIFDREVDCTNNRQVSLIFDRLEFLNTLLQKYNASIHIFTGDSIKIIKTLILELQPNYLITGQEYEPNCIDRDKKLALLCKTHDIKLCIENDHLLSPPQNTLKENGAPFKIFSPYAKKLHSKLNHFAQQEFKVGPFFFWNAQLPKQLRTNVLNNKKDKHTALREIGHEYVNYSPWTAEFTNNDIDQFSSDILTYKTNRDYLDQDGTSKFSPYLRFGFISIRECLRFALSKDNSFPWVNELLWRDFFAMALFYFPECVTCEFNKKYRSLEWKQSPSLYKAFVNRQTGYPIIDATITQLQEVGWINNRARMILASFMTKHLLLDWRLGEKLFAQHLIDYELSSNVGGWQWAASTGFDAQPYFRIFNPYLQSKKFDPKAKYIKTFLPKLSAVPEKYIHDLAKYNEKIDYPPPIVNHQEARKQAIKFFREH